MLTLYRILAILFCFCGVAIAVTHDFSQPFLKIVAVLGLTVALLTLLLFANVCEDVRSVRNRDEPVGIRLFDDTGEISSLVQPRKSESIHELGHIPIRDVGDRRFKADPTKVCKSCKFVDEESRICRKDNLSLEGITIHAVGCQHWVLGLTVAEKPHEPEGESEEQNKET